MKHNNNKPHLKVGPLATGIAMAILATQASAVEFHGYARSGIGISDDGDQQCGVSVRHVGRLGNECETYAELDLQEELFNQDGKTFRVQTMLAYWSDQDNDYESLGSDDYEFEQDANGQNIAVKQYKGGDIALRQMNIQAKGVLEFAPEATLWAGKRFYQRHDIHHLDFFYWDTSGPGAGIEGMDLGAGKLSLAWMKSDRAGDNGEFEIEGEPDVNGNIFDVRYAGIPLGSNSLEVGVSYYHPNLTSEQEEEEFSDDGGALLTGELNTPFMGGFNKLVLQYGTEGYAHALRYEGGGNWYSLENAGDSGKSIRLIDWGVFEPADRIELGYAAYYVHYDRDSFDNAHNAWSISARPAYVWSDYQRTYLEVGYYEADDDTWGEAEESKITIAQAWSAGPDYWARPEIRVFASYVTGQSGDSGFFRDGEDNALNFGVQMEAWW